MEKIKIDKEYMTIIIHKLLSDIKAKEYDYGCSGAKISLTLGKEEALVLLDALEKNENGITA